MTKTQHAHAENSNMVTEAVDSIRAASKEIVDGTVHGYQALADSTRSAAKQADKYVRHNPWMAVGAGIGVGLLLGMFLRRSK